MKYESELIKEIVDTKGHEKSLLHYESECIETWIDEAKGSYPKLTDYRSEWLNYIDENPIGKFPYISLSDVTDATIDNVVPYAYKSAVLKGKTDENLQSVKVPVLTTTGKNLFDGKLEYGLLNNKDGRPMNSNDFVRSQNFIPINCERITFTVIKGECGLSLYFYDKDKNFISYKTKTKVSDDLSIPEGVAYLKFRTYPITAESITNNLNTQIQIEEGKGATDFEPYQSIILIVNEDVTLRGIGNVKDELNLLTGELTQRIGEINSKDLSVKGITKGTYANVILINRSDFLFNGWFVGHIYSDKLAEINKGDLNWDNEASIGGIVVNPGGFWIVVDKTIETKAQADVFLQNLEANIQYKLATESIKTVDLSITDQDGNTLSKIKPIEGTMHLATSSDTLKPTFSGEIPVEATTQNLSSFIEE